MLIPGVIDHGLAKNFFIDFTECGKGANLGCSVILCSLVQHVQARGYLPPKLTLQSDNTSADFKNTVTLDFLGYLVDRGVFEEVNYFFTDNLSCSIYVGGAAVRHAVQPSVFVGNITKKNKKNETRLYIIHSRMYRLSPEPADRAESRSFFERLFCQRGVLPKGTWLVFFDCHRDSRGFSSDTLLVPTCWPYAF